MTDILYTWPYIIWPTQNDKYFNNDGLLLYLWPTLLFTYGHLIFHEGHHCNDLFSRFEQQTSILEILAEATDPTTDRQGHDGPSQGLVSKHLENLKLGTENRLSELRDGMAERTVTGVTDRHRLFSGN